MKTAASWVEHISHGTTRFRSTALGERDPLPSKSRGGFGCDKPPSSSDLRELCSRELSGRECWPDFRTLFLSVRSIAEKAKDGAESGYGTGWIARRARFSFSFPSSFPPSLPPPTPPSPPPFSFFPSPPAPPTFNSLYFFIPVHHPGFTCAFPPVQLPVRPLHDGTSLAYRPPSPFPFFPFHPLTSFLLRNILFDAISLFLPLPFCNWSLLVRPPPPPPSFFLFLLDVYDYSVRPLTLDPLFPLTPKANRGDWQNLQMEKFPTKYEFTPKLAAASTDLFAISSEGNRRPTSDGRPRDSSQGRETSRVQAGVGNPRGEGVYTAIGW